jgi:hypothetical protein
MQGKRTVLSMVSGLSFAMGMATPALAMISLPCGWYAEGNVGYAHISDKSFPLDTSTGRNIGGNLNIGYKFMPYFALEVGATRYANTNIQDDDGTNVAKIEHGSAFIAGRGIIPIIDSGFELFAKVGVARSLAKVIVQDADIAADNGITNSRSYATGVYLGVGGQYYIWPELAVNVQWQRADGNNNTGTYDFYSVGLSFIFY